MAHGALAFLWCPGVGGHNKKKLQVAASVMNQYVGTRPRVSIV